ncbi:hypothetical protein GKE82_07125 [Conexibacter sp. W3-3-2]|nr:hypothetical protein [Conexibacter sp. W3-3-2]
MTLVARFDAPLPARSAWRPTGTARIDRQRARLRAPGRPAWVCVATVAARTAAAPSRPVPCPSGGPTPSGFPGRPVTRDRWSRASSCGHFAERHGLIVIIALGESIVALGMGASEEELTGLVVLAAVLGTVVTASLWWVYFDVVAQVAERHLHRATGAARNAMARDSSSCIHLLMIAGIVLLALGIKKTLGHVDEPLKTIPAVALGGGTPLYLLGHVLFRLRNVRSVAWRRIAAAAACVALIPLAKEVDSVFTLTLIAAILVAMIAYEAVRFAEARDRIRHAPA